MNKTFLLSLLAIASLLAAPPVKAQMFSIGYDFADHPTGAAPATATTPGITLSNVVRASGFQDGNNPQYFAQGGLSVSPNGTGGYGYPNTVGDSTAAGFYVSFTLTPTTAISLTNLTFGGGFQNPGTVGSTTLGLSYSTNGTTFTTVAPTTTTFTGDGTGGSTNPTVSSFSLVGQTGLSADTAPVTFRLFLLSASGNGYQDASYVNPTNANGLDVAIAGAAVAAGAPTPEPGTWAMLVVGAGTLIYVQRMRRLTGKHV